MSSAVEDWKAGVKAARIIFDEHLAELTAEYSGMFAGIQGSTINVGQTKDELYALMDPLIPYLIILIEENPPPTIDIFTHIEKRRTVLDKLIYAVSLLDDTAVEELTEAAKAKWINLKDVQPVP